MYNTDDIDKFFVKSAYRDGQREAIKFVLDSFNSGKKIVIIEAPTGSGKTAIGMTVAKFFDNMYWLTATKQLQDQLVAEYGSIVTELKGRNAYECDVWERMKGKRKWNLTLAASDINKLDNGFRNCSVGICKTNLLGSSVKCRFCFENADENIFLPPGRSYSACAYYEQLHKAMNSRFLCMNFSSFLYQTTFTKDRFVDPRSLLITDEAHNLGQEILSFVNVTISDVDLKERGYALPVFDSPNQYKNWFLEKNIIGVFKELEEIAIADEDHIAARDFLGVAGKIEMFVKNDFDDCEWVMDHETKFSPSVGEYRVLSLRPVLVGDFAERFIFRHGDKILLMSATILDVDTFCNTVGIDRSDVAALRMKNRFPVEHRPIYYWPAAQMTGGKDKMVDWGPPLVGAVEAIVNKFGHQRGIIHTHNNAIMEYLSLNCESSVSKRFKLSKDYMNKSDLLDSHALSHDSIIVSPSLYEGVDLKDDLSRFQIVCKMPFANFYDDKQLAARMKLDDKYYDWVTVLRLVQSVGRSVRSHTDFADTFVIDGSFERLFKKAKAMFPMWFKEAVIDISSLKQVASHQLF